MCCGFWYFNKEQRTASKEQSGIVKQQEEKQVVKENSQKQGEEKVKYTFLNSEERFVLTMKFYQAQ